MVIYRQETIRLGKKNKNKLSNGLEVVETREFNRLSIAFWYNYHNGWQPFKTRRWVKRQRI